MMRTSIKRCILVRKYYEQLRRAITISNTPEVLIQLFLLLKHH